MDLGKDIRAIISVPRLIICDTVWCIINMCTQLHIDVNRASGAFWGQSMNKIMNATIDDAKYILALDSDSLFTQDDIILLHDIMEKRQDIDAIAALQMQRNDNRVIAGYMDNYFKDGILSPEIMFCDTFEVEYAHFGLTLIRTESLKKVHKPWFVGFPGDDGDWGNDRIDEDIHFWKQWRKYGNNIHIANNVPIGHIEFVASWPDKRLQKCWQHPHEFFTTGKPKECWPNVINEVSNAGITEVTITWPGAQRATDTTSGNPSVIPAEMQGTGGESKTKPSDVHKRQTTGKRTRKTTEESI